ncbi:MAG: Adenylate kinase, partial [uncultured Thermomicrobiales bacterium]
AEDRDRRAARRREGNAGQGRGHALRGAGRLDLR